MELTAHPEQSVGPFSLSTGKGYPFVPTIVDLDVSWSAPSVVAVPEPARATARLWIPDAGDEVLFDDTALSRHLPRLNSPMLSLLCIDGDVSAPVLAFAGRVDSVTRDRSRADRPSRPIRYLTVPAGSTMTWTRSADGAAVTTPVDVSDGTIKVTIPQASAWTIPDVSDFAMGVLPLASLASPNHALWVGEGTLDRYRSTRLSDNPVFGDLQPPAPRGYGAWFWRANGQHTPVSAGPLLIGSTVPGDLALIAYGRLSVTATPPVVATRPLTYQHTRPSARPSGWWLTVTASDDLALAGRHKIGAPPWPEETALVRAQRLGTLSAPPFPVPIMRGVGAIPEPIRTELAAVRVVPQDVDNQPMLDVVAKTLAVVGAIPYATRQGVVARRTDLSDVDTLDTVVIAPAAVPDVEQSVEVVNLVNRVTVTYTDPVTEPGESVERQVTVSNAASIAAWGESSARWETLATLTSTDTNPAANTVVGRAVTQMNAGMYTMLNPRWSFARPVLVQLDETCCELLLNGDFESTPNWLYTRSARLTTPLAHSGKRVVKLSPATSGAAYARSQPFDVPKVRSTFGAMTPAPIVVTAYFRPDPSMATSSVDLTVRLAYYEMVGTTTRAITFVPGTATVIPSKTDGWVKVTGTITPAADVTQLRIAPYADAVSAFGAAVWADTVSARPDGPHACRSFARLLDVDTRHAARVAIPHTLPEVPTRFHLVGGSVAMSRGDVTVGLTLRPGRESS